MQDSLSFLSPLLHQERSGGCGCGGGGWSFAATTYDELPLFAVAYVLASVPELSKQRGQENESWVPPPPVSPYPREGAPFAARGQGVNWRAPLQGYRGRDRRQCPGEGHLGKAPCG